MAFKSVNVTTSPVPRRIEIFLPSGLQNSLTLDEIAECKFTRNELLYFVMRRCEKAEK